MTGENLAAPAWAEPNIWLLDNALRQTSWQGDEVTLSNWRQIVAGKLDTLDWRAALNDVSPFLERPEDAAWVTPERLHRLLQA